MRLKHSMKDTSNSYADAFWYLNSLAGFASNGVHKFCRQTFLGGFYELVDKHTQEPNPDYYVALLYTQLMADGIVSASVKDAVDGSSDVPSFRAYAQCAKGSKPGAVTVVLLNYSKATVSVALPLKGATRHEYRMTPEHNKLTSRVVLLNGKSLRLGGDDGNTVPELKPAVVTHRKHTNDDQAKPEPFKLLGQTYSFVVFPDADHDGCKSNSGAEKAATESQAVVE
jgi:hypothetical protein